MFVKN